MFSCLAAAGRKCARKREGTEIEETTSMANEADTEKAKETKMTCEGEEEIRRGTRVDRETLLSNKVED